MQRQRPQHQAQRCMVLIGRRRGHAFDLQHLHRRPAQQFPLRQWQRGVDDTLDRHHRQRQHQAFVFQHQAQAAPVAHRGGHHFQRLQAGTAAAGSVEALQVLQQGDVQRRVQRRTRAAAARGVAAALAQAAAEVAGTGQGGIEAGQRGSEGGRHAGIETVAAPASGRSSVSRVSGCMPGRRLQPGRMLPRPG